MPKRTYDEMLSDYPDASWREQVRRRCDNLLGSCMPEDVNDPDTFPQDRFRVQEYARTAAASLGLVWVGGDVEFPDYLDGLNGPNATLTRFWNQSNYGEKWAGRAIATHLGYTYPGSKKVAQRLIKALNHEVAMVIAGFQREECVAVCGVCDKEHNFALDGLWLCGKKFMTNDTQFCYPVTPNVVREADMVRHPLYAAALHRAAPTLSIEHQWGYGLGWTLIERVDGERRSVPAPVDFPRHDEFVKKLRLNHLHAAYTIARAYRKHLHKKYKPGGAGAKKAEKHFDQMLKI